MGTQVSLERQHTCEITFTEPSKTNEQAGKDPPEDKNTTITFPLTDKAMISGKLSSVGLEHAGIMYATTNWTEEPTTNSNTYKENQHNNNEHEFNLNPASYLDDNYAESDEDIFGGTLVRVPSQAALLSTTVSGSVMDTKDDVQLNKTTESGSHTCSTNRDQLSKVINSEQAAYPETGSSTKHHKPRHTSVGHSKQNKLPKQDSKTPQEKRRRRNSKQEKSSNKKSKRGARGSNSVRDWHESNETCAFYDCIMPDDEKIDWVQCDDCDQWYHTVCVGCSYSAVKENNAQYHCGCM